MNIKEWWDRMLAKFWETDVNTDSEGTMELVAEQAPEPVPERKTSDEMIVQMADSTLEGDSERITDAAEEDGEERMEEPVPECEDETDGF